MSGLRAPTTQDILRSGVNPFRGIQVNVGDMSMGLRGAGPNVPSHTWEPRGVDGRFQQGVAAFLKNMRPPTNMGGISIKSTGFLQYTYTLRNIDDGADLRLVPDMLMLVIRERETETGAYVATSLAEQNRRMQEQWDQFVNSTTGDEQTNMEFSIEAFEFLCSMQWYGEGELYKFHHARENKDARVLKTMDEAKLPDGVLPIKDFYERSLQTDYQWLTMFGIEHRLNLAGVLATTDRGIDAQALELTQREDHYMNANIAVAKRIKCAQVFGTNEDIGVGASLWLQATRKPCGDKWGAFCLYPGGSKFHRSPLMQARTYLDESGAFRQGRLIRVGKVQEPAGKPVSTYAQQQANNTIYHVRPVDSYEAFHTLPTFYMLLGFY